MKRIAALVGTTGLALAMGALGAYAQGKPLQTQKTPAAAAGAKMAIAKIEPRSGSQVRGTATFTETGGKVKLSLMIEGATPGVHAVHLHEKGDCSDAEGKSAGGHWNPSSENHGMWGTAPFHHGDIGNVNVGADGKGTFTLETDLWSVGGDPAKDVVGKAVIVHAAPDDFKTQPTGNAGGRVACGVVEPAK